MHELKFLFNLDSVRDDHRRPHPVILARQYELVWAKCLRMLGYLYHVYFGFVFSGNQLYIILSGTNGPLADNRVSSTQTSQTRVIRGSG